MTSTSDLPLATRLAWWGTAWLRGSIGPDDLIDAVAGGGPDDPHRDVAHLVLTAHDTADDTAHDTAHDAGSDVGSTPLLVELAGARSAGATAVAAGFPVPGDPAGLRGSRAFSAAAIDSGEAVLLLGAGRALVPWRVGRAVEWTSFTVDRRPPPDLGEADRALRSTLLSAANLLADLDVARWRPEVADELHDLRRTPEVAAPPGVPERCVELAGRALHLWAVAEMALQDDGGALSVGEAAARRLAIEPLDRVARHALGAACSPDGWPQG